MNSKLPLTPAADARHPMPAGPGARLDGAHAALASLRAEERRLERLGLEPALLRCREQRRYWEFLVALFALPPDPSRSLPRGEF